MGFKRLFFGEPMPDKNDPRYRERYERDVEAGRKFADATGLSWLGMQVQRFGQQHKRVFLVIVFGIVLGCFALNVVRLVRVYRSGPPAASGVERVDSIVRQRIDHVGN